MLRKGRIAARRPVFSGGRGKLSMLKLLAALREGTGVPGDAAARNRIPLFVPML
jgi:hypothetical protein